MEKCINYSVTMQWRRQLCVALFHLVVFLSFSFFFHLYSYFCMLDMINYTRQQRGRETSSRFVGEVRGKGTRTNIASLGWQSCDTLRYRQSSVLTSDVQRGGGGGGGGGGWPPPPPLEAVTSDL